MSQPILVLIIIVALAGAAYLIFLHRRTSKLSAAVANVPSLLTNAVTDLKSHFSAVSAGAETRLFKLVTRSPAPAAPAKPLPVVGTTAEPAPAAPAVSAAVEPPPATVAPAAPPAAPAPSAGGSGTDTWPQVIEVDGVHMLADAPINPAFKLDVTTKAYDNAHSYLFDPSNGGKCNPPQPTRSPAGFPLFYAIGAGNAPVGAPRVLYNGQTFADDAAVASYITALATAHAADDVSAAAAAAQVFAGPVPVASLTHADLQFLWWATINPATPKMHNWEYTVLSGSRAAIQQAMATIGNNVAQMHGYDATKYAGILRSYYDEAVKA